MSLEDKLNILGMRGAYMSICHHFDKTKYDFPQYTENARMQKLEAYVDILNKMQESYDFDCKYKIKIEIENTDYEFNGY